jgi:hypothetical protein
VTPSPAPIIGLHGAPRSGTSWLGQIFNSSPEVAYRYQPFFAHAYRERAMACRTPRELAQLLEDIRASRDDFVLQRGAGAIARRQLTFAKGAATHIVYKEVRFHHKLPSLMLLAHFRGIGLIRNPLEALNSWVRAPREFRSEWSLADEWRFAPAKNLGRPEEFYGYEGWKSSALLFERLQAKAPDRFRVVRYADLVEAPRATVSSLFEFAGLPFTAEVEAFIDLSTSTQDDDPYGVFRKATGAPVIDLLPSGVSSWIADDARVAGLGRHL